MAEECAIAVSVAFDLVKDQRRRIGRMLAIEHVDNGAHLEVPVDVFKRTKLAEFVDFYQPITQAVINHVYSLTDNTFKPRRSQHGEAATKAAILIHHRGTEIAEFGVFLNQELITPRPPRLRGEISFGPIQSA